ncbi:serine O-acetyltransferase EpsC [Reichenbachiella versicolor]|uniref:serine O-acetyltransferase EpsC n=1 Tax=Reichenbachiella versicolor TaxID=1821036 RepID=UPI000D6E3180|nr:serine O-acetyltransferase EpsC [Reichenbachiella versicolor]
MKDSLLKKLHQAHNIPKELPGEKEIDDFMISLLQFLFPERNNIRLTTDEQIIEEHKNLRDMFRKLLSKTKCDDNKRPTICESFFNQLEDIYDAAMEDAQAILEGDPAAVDKKEVIRSYPGFFAIAIYRIAHVMLELGIPYLPRIMTEYAHFRTAIDIHPGAKIGKRFCIDHGTGIVIGETTIIGDNVKIYQGVTLGALSIKKGMARTKRHPTIDDNVVIYANATILGGETNIGANSIVGGNVWITQSVPDNSRVYYEKKENILIKESI